MILDIFSELQRARPSNEGHERRLLADAIEQARLADELGYGCWWNVEHHGAPEFSYSSAPELILSWIALFVGALLCGIGLFVAVPVVVIAHTYAYKVLRGQPVAA